MKIFVTVGVWEGKACEVNATVDFNEARANFLEMKFRYGLTEEEEAQKDVKQFEVEW